VRHILELKLKKEGLEATGEARDVAIGLLSKACDRPNLAMLKEDVVWSLELTCS
jgi:hypothetical protein